jgi:Cutinase
MRIRSWFMLLLGLATAALFVPTAVAVPAANAQPVCNNVYMIGLHGMNEDYTSPTIQDTYNVFSAKAIAQGHGGVYLNSLDYEEDFYSLYGIGYLAGDASGLGIDIYTLQSTVAGILDTCPGARISLVGYSEGAWIVDLWLQQNHDEWKYIKAVVYYGDPCYRNGSYEGLARFYTSSCYSTYPAPAGAPFWTWSVCNPKDPVCGYGFGDSAAAKLAQDVEAVDCGSNAACTHRHYTDGYPSKGWVVEGGNFLAQHAFG